MNANSENGRSTPIHTKSPLTSGWGCTCVIKNIPSFGRHLSSQSVLQFTEALLWTKPIGSVLDLPQKMNKSSQRIKETCPWLYFMNIRLYQGVCEEHLQFLLFNIYFTLSIMYLHRMKDAFLLKQRDLCICHACLEPFSIQHSSANGCALHPVVGSNHRGFLKV